MACASSSGVATVLLSRSCVICSAVGATHTCGACCLRHYCSVACQRSDWATHKSHCDKEAGDRMRHLRRSPSLASTDIPIGSLSKHLVADAVEQILSWLDVVSTISAGQACQGLRAHVAESPLVWAKKQTLVATIGPKQYINPVYSLVRHAISEVRWTDPAGSQVATYNPDDAAVESALRELSPVCSLELASMLSVPLLRNLDASRRFNVSAGLWHTLLAYPQFAQLERLHIGPMMQPGDVQPDERVMRRVGQLPKLHSLVLRPHPAHRVPAAAFEALQHFPALTALAYIDWGMDNLRRLPSSSAAFPRDLVPLCPTLRQLCIIRPLMLGGSFATFFTHPNMCSLRHLTLLRYAVNDRFGTSDADYIRSCAALVQLCTLRLVDVPGVGRLLPHLAHCPLLKRVRLEFGPDTPLPEAHMLATLLQRAPHLESVELHVSFSAANEQANRLQQLEALVDMYGARVRLSSLHCLEKAKDLV